MYISIIIASGRQNIEECLNSLLNQICQEYEIIIVSESDMKIRNNNKVRFLKVEDGNVSFKRNRGAEMASGEIFCFVDDDVVVPTDYLEKAETAFKRYPSMDGFGGANLLPIDAPFLEKISDQVLNFNLFGSGLDTYSNHHIDRIAKTGELHSCNLFIKKNAFNKIFGFNEMIRFGGEDTELVYLAQKRQKMEFRFISDIFVYHHRRKFGLSYFRQRFLSKSNLGRLLWVYPEIYLSSRSFVLLSVGVIVFLSIIPFYPMLLPILLALYLALLIGLSLKYLLADWRLFFIMPMAVALHNFTYLLAIIYGFMSSSWAIDKLRLVRR